MWSESYTELAKTFQFKNFTEALAFIVKVGILAEKADHHPTIINTYNKVELKLSTHSAGNTVTVKDRSLSAAIDLL